MKQIIEKVKAKLIFEQPYFGTIVSSLNVIENNDIQTFQTQNDIIEFNSEFLATLSTKQIAFTLTNCAMHYAFDYNNRQNNRIQWLWLLAKDYAINNLLIKNNLTPPKYINYDIRFQDCTAEKIYTILKDEIDNKEENYNSVKHIKYDKKQISLDDNKSNQKHILKKAKEYGELPLGIELLITDIYKGTINWQDELYEIIEQSFKFDYQLIPPNKRYISYGIALPSLNGTITKIVIAIDSSGSIDNNKLTTFLSEVSSIMENFINYEIDLIIADAKVQEHIVISTGDNLPSIIKGGGGTNFINTFEYIQKNIYNVDIFLYFTDGIGKFPNKVYDFDTIWVLSGDVNIPFGRKILIDKGIK